MKIVEIRRKSKKELERLLKDSQEKLRQLRFNLVSGKVKNVREIRALRKDIAKILTTICQKNNSKEK